MTERDNFETIDRNLAALLRQAPAARAADEVRERIFHRVMRRLDAQRRRQRVIFFGYLATAAAVLLAVAVTIRPWQSETPVAPAGGVDSEATLLASGDKKLEHSLPDGSGLVISPDSRVAVKRMPGKIRPDVVLEKGEVICRVAKGKERFVLRTPGGQVTALGTEFSARLEPAASHRRGATPVLAVSVLSGQVLVTDNIGREYLAAAGDQVRVGAQETPQAKEDWQSAVLVARLQDGRQGEPLEVRRHSVTVTIHDQLALVEVDEVFYNPSDERLEGTFFFPLPPGATLCRLAMYVGDRLMEGELAEARRARRTFEALKVQRIDPALLEWAGGNNFKMRVFPIEPKSEKRVLLSYYQVLEKEHDRVRFVYPLASDMLQTQPVGRIEIKATVFSSAEILSAASQPASVEVKSSAHGCEAFYQVEQRRSEEDFVLDYRVAAGESELVVVPFWHRPTAEGYFLMIFSPLLKEADSSKPRSSRFVFVVDKSGGLGNRHLALAVQTAKAALARLQGGDLFGIVAYDSVAQCFRPEMAPAASENIEEASAWLDSLSALGASDLPQAWQAAARLAGSEETQIIYIGNGLSNLTSTRSSRLLEDAKAAFANARVRIHALAIGGVQDAVFLDELARAFSGVARQIMNAEDMAEKVEALMSDYAWPVYENVELQIEGVKTGEIYPARLPNVTAGRQLFAFGKYYEQGKCKVTLNAQLRNEKYSQTFEVDFGGQEKNEIIPPLWATRKIEHLQNQAALADAEEAARLARAIIELSKRYTVISQYTSFLVLETPEDYLRYGIERRERLFLSLIHI